LDDLVFISIKEVEMIITIRNGQSFDTDKDLTAAERHILQKLFIWKSMAGSVEEFREKREIALKAGWNDSGPIKASHTLSLIIRDLEQKVVSRLQDK
jgi:hypothetical protein